MLATKIIYFILIVSAIARIGFYYKEEGSPVFQQNSGYENTISSIPIIKKIRETSIETAWKSLPSPHSELLLGMTIGIDEMGNIPIFKQMLKDTSTIHVVVVSGYNINLVFNSLMRILGTKYKLRNLLLGLLGTFLFAILSGFESPVIRAWIMGAVLSFGKFYGRNTSVMHVLSFTAIVMCLVNPEFFFNISFQMSFLATLSLVLFSEKVSTIVSKVTKSKLFFVEDFCTSVAAQILLWPYLSYKFGRISLFSPFINGFVLWSVPLITMFGGIYLIISNLLSFNIIFLANLVYIPLEFFVKTIEFSSKLKFLTINISISSYILLIYYVILIILLRKTKNGS